MSTSRHLPQVGLSSVEIPYPLRAGFEFFEDFERFGKICASGTDDTGMWTIGGTNGVIGGLVVPDAGSTPVLPTGTAAIDHHGVIRLTTTGASGDEMQLQAEGSPFLCVAGRVLKFQARFMPHTITTSTQYFGLNITDSTDVIGTQVNGFGVALVSGTYQIQAKNAATTVATSTAFTAAADSGVNSTGWQTVGATWDGIGTIRFYVNGREIGSNTTALPTGIRLTPTMAIGTTSSATKAMDVDYFWASLEGPTSGR